MLALSKSEGIGGAIKQAAEDFVVEEITENGTVLEAGQQYSAKDLGMQVDGGGRFTVFVMQKSNWNTIQALKRIAAWQRRGIKSVGFAGTKDRTSVSTQLCSIYGVTPEQLGDVRLKDLRINGAWRANEGIKMGELLGNRFTILVKDVKRPENIERINAELGGIFPNYFGEQRFGYRNNNVEIGVDIIKGDFKSAAMRFLTDTTNERNEDAISARNKLRETEDFRGALEYFPKYLRYERQLLDHLSMIPSDFAGAIRRLPRTLSLMFVHSVDSYIFNTVIENRIRDGLTAPQPFDKVCRADRFGFPITDKIVSVKDAGKDEGKLFIVGNIVGYDNEINEVEKEVINGLGITQEQFKVKSMPELNCKGAYKVLFAPYVNFSYETRENEIGIQFSLPSGSYATVLMEEFLKRKN
ncbi:MAG: tRNA pseudouridine(13) synthase TruD [Candidatus Micrarchaeales archaeon]|nr:tRNA pseudouridine(13) synthase TruD [Candidatus Micrarchaeales archaeon]